MYMTLLLPLLRPADGDTASDVTTQTTTVLVRLLRIDTVANLDAKLQIKLKDGSGTMKIDAVSVKQGFEDQHL